MKNFTFNRYERYILKQVATLNDEAFSIKENFALKTKKCFGCKTQVVYYDGYSFYGKRQVL